MKFDRNWCWALGLVLWGACGGNVRNVGDQGTTSAAGSGPGVTLGAGGTAGGVGNVTVSGSGGSSSGAAGAGTAGAGGSGDGSGPCDVGSSEALWLTNREYDNTIRDLLGIEGTPPISVDAQLPEDSMDIGFRRDALQFPSTDATHRMSHYLAASTIVVAKAKARLSEIVHCDPAVIGEDGCARAFISVFGLRAFRHPLSPDEADILHTEYQNGRARGTFEEGIGQVISAALLSPSFLQVERAGTAGVVTKLDPYAIASRLSYFIYRSMPDPELFAAAASGGLADGAGIASQVQRMLRDPKAHAAVIAFFTEWLTLERLTGTPYLPGLGITKSPAVTVDFPTLASYMRTETEMFGESAFFAGKSLPTLLTSTRTWVNEPLAQVYGIPGVTGLDMRQADVDPASRAGLLTQPSILSLSDLPDRGSPTQRGTFVLSKFLCQDVPPPPPNMAMVPPAQPGQTTREQYQSMNGQGICAACHQLLDPIGFGFESFDAIGRYRTMDNGKPIDSSGQITISEDGTSASFRNAVELSATLAGSRAVHDCFAKQWFRFALSRRETDQDMCALSQIQSEFRKADSMQALVTLIATSPPFLSARW